MNDQNIISNSLALRIKLASLRHRINRVRERLDTCTACTPESRDLMFQLVHLVQQRNDLHTPADVYRIERERGLA